MDVRFSRFTNSFRRTTPEPLGDNRRVMERAFRVVVERVRVDPSHANKQVASLIRRAIELGIWRWDWDETRPVP
jgi:hypothetical protein